MEKQSRQALLAARGRRVVTGSAAGPAALQVLGHLSRLRVGLSQPLICALRGENGTVSAALERPSPGKGGLCGLAELREGAAGPQFKSGSTYITL